MQEDEAFQFESGHLSQREKLRREIALDLRLPSVRRMAAEEAERTLSAIAADPEAATQIAEKANRPQKKRQRSLRKKKRK